MGLELGPSNKMRVDETRVMGNKGGPQKDAVLGKWRKLLSEELQNLYSSPNIIQGIIARKIKWAMHVAPMGEGRGAYRILVGK